MPGPNTATYLERLLTFFKRAVDVSYDPTESGLTATDVQAAIDEVAGSVGSVTAADVSYNQSTTFLGANVQAALDVLGKDVQSIAASEMGANFTPTSLVTTILLNQNLTVNILSPRVGVFRFLIQQDGTGGWTVDFGSYYTPGGAGYTNTPTANSFDIIDLTSTNGSVFLTVLGQDYST